MTEQPLTELSLFSGYGGFSLGLQLSGIKTRVIAYVEWAKYPQQILQARIRDGYIDDAPIFGNISAFPSEKFRGLVGIISAGFPCPPFSVAGERKMATDDRNMWPQTLSVVDIIRPRIVLLENVAGILSGKADEGIPAYGGVVVGQLAELGYCVSWRTIGARDVGAPHRRIRWLCIAVLEESELAHSDGGNDGGVFQERKCSESHKGRSCGERTAETGSRPHAELGYSDRGRFKQRQSETESTRRISQPGESELADSINDGPYPAGADAPESSGNESSDGVFVRGYPAKRAELADSDAHERFLLRRSQPGEDQEKFPRIGDRGGIERPGIMADSNSDGGGEDNKSTELRADRAIESSSHSGLPGTGEDEQVEGRRWNIYPTWPPGPGERERWEQILADRPDLAPAISEETERQLRGMDDGGADLLDPSGAVIKTSRNGRLRALGNGLVPAVVAEFLEELKVFRNDKEN